MKITIDTTNKTIIIHESVKIGELIEFLTGPNQIRLDEYSIEPQESKLNNTKTVEQPLPPDISDILEKLKRDQEKKNPYTKDWDSPLNKYWYRTNPTEIPCGAPVTCKEVKWEPENICSTTTDDAEEPDIATFFYSNH